MCRFGVRDCLVAEEGSGGCVGFVKVIRENKRRRKRISGCFVICMVIAWVICRRVEVG